MKIHKINNNLIDVFIDKNTFPTGYEESCWIRLQKKLSNWIQIKGTKVPSWKFKQVLSEVETFINTSHKPIPKRTNNA